MLALIVARWCSRRATASSHRLQGAHAIADLVRVRFATTSICSKLCSELGKNSMKHKPVDVAWVSTRNAAGTEWQLTKVDNFGRGSAIDVDVDGQPWIIVALFRSGSYAAAKECHEALMQQHRAAKHREEFSLLAPATSARR